MWVEDQKSFFEVHCDFIKFTYSLQLPVFMLDETGYILSSSSDPCGTTRGYIMGASLVHDECDDG